MKKVYETPVISVQEFELEGMASICDLSNGQPSTYGYTSTNGNTTGPLGYGTLTHNDPV